MSVSISLTTKEQQKLDVITDCLAGKITKGQAGKILDISPRQIKRLKHDVKLHGATAVIHKLKGKTGNRHIAEGIKHKALTLIKTEYSDFKPTFASEKLQENHDIVISPETIRRWMIEEGLLKIKHHKQTQYRAFRERKDYFGEMEQFDGSYHLWFEKRLLDDRGNPIEVCLLASIDDATGKITHAKFDLNEGVEAVFNFWLEYILIHGKPLKVYLDRFSTYKVNHKAAVDNSELLTQFQRAAQQLVVELVVAHSPEAKGRIERLFQTLQDRLVKELRLASINTLEEGNRYLQEVFIPKFNSKFAVVARKKGDVHRKVTKEERGQLGRIFSSHSRRMINPDFTIQFKNHWYQLKEIQPLTLRPREQVMIEEWLDHTLHISKTGKELNYFTLPERPKKIVNQPAILTNHKLNWKPPENHPWKRYFKISR